MVDGERIKRNEINLRINIKSLKRYDCHYGSCEGAEQIFLLFSFFSLNAGLNYSDFLSHPDCFSHGSLTLAG